MFYRAVSMFILGAFWVLGASFVAPAGATPTGGTTNPDWVGQTALPQGMILTNIECLSDTFCKAVFDGDSLIGWDGNEWVIEYLNQASAQGTFVISCASEDLCKAVGDNGQILSWNGQIWTTDNSGTSVTLVDVTCPSEMLCKAVGAQTSVLSWNGIAWSTESTASGNNFVAIDCVTAILCKASTSAEVYTWDSTNWTMEAPFGFSDVTCPTATFCLAVRPMIPNPVYVWSGANWQPFLDFPLMNRPGFAPKIECASPTQCLVLSMNESGTNPVLYTNLIWALDNGNWNPVLVENNLAEGQFVQDLTCFGTSSCKVVFQNSKIALWNGETISFELNGALESFNAVDCPAVNLCKAVGDSGLIKSWNGTEWTEEESNTGVNLYSVTCLSTTSCKTTGESNVWLTWNGTAWSEEIITVPDSRSAGGNYAYITSLTCPSATLCKAIGQQTTENNSDVLSWNGTEWQVDLNETDISFQYTAVSCPTTSFCMVNGNDTFIWDGSEWSATTTSAMAVFDCVTATFCMGHGGDFLQQWNGSSWTSQEGISNILSIDCVSETFCQANTAEAIYFWDGTAWTSETVATSLLKALNCFSTTFCVGVGDYGTVLEMVAHTLVDVSAEFEVDVYQFGGCNAPLTITQVNSDHPNATSQLLTGRYWTVEAEECVTEVKGQLTLPTTLTTEPADMVCSYNGRLWVCESPVSTTTNTYTIEGLLPLSDMAIRRPGPNASAYQQFLPLIQR